VERLVGEPMRLGLVVVGDVLFPVGKDPVEVNGTDHSVLRWELTPRVHRVRDRLSHGARKGGVASGFVGALGPLLERHAGLYPGKALGPRSCSFSRGTEAVKVLQTWGVTCGVGSVLANKGSISPGASPRFPHCSFDGPPGNAHPRLVDVGARGVTLMQTTSNFISIHAPPPPTPASVRCAAGATAVAAAAPQPVPRPPS